MGFSPKQNAPKHKNGIPFYREDPVYKKIGCLALREKCTVVWARAWSKSETVLSKDKNRITICAIVMIGPWKFWWNTARVVSFLHWNGIWCSKSSQKFKMIRENDQITAWFSFSISKFCDTLTHMVQMGTTKSDTVILLAKSNPVVKKSNFSMGLIFGSLGIFFHFWRSGFAQLIHFRFLIGWNIKKNLLPEKIWFFDHTVFIATQPSIIVFSKYQLQMWD